ncbi:MAG: hypothetical protein ACR2PK_08535 [Acidimicrobiales bacterium]
MSELSEETGSGPRPTAEARPRPERPPRGGAASGAKIVVAGLAVGAGLTIAGTMAATAQIAQVNETPQTYIQRVVVVPEDTTQPQLAALVASDSQRSGALLASAGIAPHPATGAAVPQAESEAS